MTKSFYNGLRRGRNRNKDSFFDHNKESLNHDKDLCLSA